jgi:hypothetical protein
MNPTGYVVVNTADPATSIEVGNVDLGKTVPKPQYGLTLLHGFEASKRYMSKLLAEPAPSPNHQIMPITLQVDLAQKKMPISYTMEDLQQQQGLNAVSLGHARASMVSHIMMVLHQYTEQDGTPLEAPYKNGTFMTNRPDLIARMLNEDDAFQGLDALIYNVSETGSVMEMVQVITILNPAVITNVSPFMSEFAVHIPAATDARWGRCAKRPKDNANENTGTANEQGMTA